MRWSPPPKPAGGKLGDINGDQKVDVKDAVLLARYVGNDGVELDAQAMANANVDGISSVTVDDLTYLLQCIAGLKALKS